MDFPTLKSKAILAPMSGVTDIAFRTLAKKYGAALTYTEFVSSAAIVRGNKSTLKMLKVDSTEKPIGVQLFGSNVEEVVQAAKFLEKKFDIIDINCGCPAYKVIKTGAGSDMLKNPSLIGELVTQISSAIKKPVTVKIRLGIDDKHINAIKVAQIAENAGAAAITVHGRTQQQGYSGKADWKTIKEVKKTISIPVIGNGDVNNPEFFKKKLEDSGVDYIMIGRAAMTNPYIFKQINDYEKNDTYEKENKVKIFENYLELANKHNISFLTIKNHATQFSKSIKGGAEFRLGISQCKSIPCLKQLFSNIE
jgi:tRNA-dihydrouridine synthase B